MTEARDNLAEALTLFFETASAEEVDRRLRGEVYVTHIEVPVASPANPFRPVSLPDPRVSWFLGSKKAG